MKDEAQVPVVLDVHIAPVAEYDVERVAQLAAEVWWRHYPGIISAAQIEYMLRQRYDPGLLRAELRCKDLWWDKLVVGDAMVAFASYFLVDDAKAIKLDKLYVHPGHQRTGYGGILIARVCERARARGCSRITLAVNKNNAGAIAAYLKYGFRVGESVVTDIGGGFIMDDYIMDRCI
jgi:GNAT superfamily N-acetyltransferase